MRRIGVAYAKPGMRLGQPIYDSVGRVVLREGCLLTEEMLASLADANVGEVIIDDPRLGHIAIQPLIPPELLGEATRALKQLLAETDPTRPIPDELVAILEAAISSITRGLYRQEFVGEPSVSGCLAPEEYDYVHPIKTAGLAMLLASRAGLGLRELTNVGMASALMHIGELALSPDVRAHHDQTGEEPAEYKKHPLHGSEMLKPLERLSPQVSQAIREHHERWDGSGYPSRLGESDISLHARVISIAATYYSLLSRRRYRRELMPHQAAEFVAAFSGELFDPDMVRIFIREVPFYPTGITVALNTGEVGVVADPNRGHVARPVVHVCFDSRMAPLEHPYDIDLSLPENQRTLVTRVMEY